MKCPNCGAKLDDDKLYCERCGTEINFVPNYEPEIEQSITETLSELQFLDMDGDFVDGSFESQDRNLTDDFEGDYYEYDQNESYYDGANANYDKQYSEDINNLQGQSGNYESALDDILYGNDESDFQEEYVDTLPDQYVSEYVSDYEPVSKSVNKTVKDTANKQKKPVTKKKVSEGTANKKTLSKNSTDSKNDKNSIADRYAEKDRLRRRKASLEYIKKDDGTPRFSHSLSDSLYYEMPSNEELDYFDEEYEIDPFDDFGYESYFFKQFLRLLKNKKIIPFIILGLLLVVGLVSYSVLKISRSIYESNSYEYQLQLAKEAADNNDYDNAIMYMEKAVHLNSSDSSIKYTLADYYFANNDDDDAILLLWEIIDANDLNRPYAYRKIINYHAERNDYETIQEILDSCDDEEIRNAFIDYTADEVEYSLEEATYDESMYIELSSKAKGTIYYTLDGTEPTTDSEVYTEPIYMEIGIYRISTLFVNNYGIRSDIKTQTFTVDIRVPNPPVILTEGGDYEVPELIEVDVQPMCKVYYTLDGTIPDDKSTEYLSPIPMPIGDSHLIFISYSQEEIPGEISEVEYHLTIDSEIEVQAFIYCLNICNFNIGRAIDVEGHLAGNTSMYQYQVSQAIAFNEQIFYLFVETIVDETGKVTKTGDLYLGDVADGSIYKAIQDEEGVISVSEIIDPLLFTLVLPENTENTEPTEVIQ